MAENSKAPKEYSPVFSGLDPTGKSEKDRIRLKRCVGKSIGDADPGALTAFYGNVRCSKEDEDKAFFIATHYCEQGGNGSMSLPEAWGRYTKQNGGNGNSLLRLLDLQWSNAVAAGLTRAIRLLSGKGYAIDFEWLFYDIKHWGEFKTRRKWAIAYSVASNKTEEKANGSKNKNEN